MTHHRRADHVQAHNHGFYSIFSIASCPLSTRSLFPQVVAVHTMLSNLILLFGDLPRALKPRARGHEGLSSTKVSMGSHARRLTRDDGGDDNNKVVRRTGDTNCNARPMFGSTLAGPVQRSAKGPSKGGGGVVFDAANISNPHQPWSQRCTGLQ